MQTGQLDERMCGSDQLAEITQDQMKQYHHKCIGLLTFKQKINKQIKDLYGTAFLISPEVLLTVAHNVYNKKIKQNSIDLTFFPGAALFSQPNRFLYSDQSKGIKIKDCFFPQQYSLPVQEEEKRRSFDYAFLRLQSPLMLKNYLKLGLNLKEGNRTLEVYGYNVNSVSASVKTAIQVGLEKPNSLILLSDLSIIHIVSTKVGNSGSPILTQVNGELVVIGIHQGCTISKQISKQQNQGRQVELRLISNLFRWLDKLRIDRSSIKFALEGEKVIQKYGCLIKRLELEEQVKKKNTFQKINKKLVLLSQKIKKSEDSSQIQIMNAAKVKEENQKLKQLARQENYLAQQINIQIINAKKYLETVERGANQLFENKLRIMKMKDKLDGSYQLQHWKQWNKLTHFASMFNITAEKVIKRECNQQLYQVVSSQIPQEGTYNADFKFSYGQDRWSLLFGLITQTRQLERYSFGDVHTETISYINEPRPMHESQGSISMDKDVIMEKSTKLFIKQGDVLRVEIAMDLQIVTFITASAKTVIKLAQSFKNKKLYFYAAMSSKGASVTFC